MSSYVALCAVLPAFSCTFGPVGTLESAGAGPRPRGTTLQRGGFLFPRQSHGAPAAGFHRAGPPVFCAAPVVAFAIHSSMPSARVFRNASFDPSGENFRFERFAFAGTVTLTGAPPPIFCNLIAWMSAVRCGPFVRGFTRA